MDHYAVIEKALVYIEDHLQQPLSVDTVSNHCNVSKYYFHRLFSAMMGDSLNQYILSRRLNASLAFIQNEHLSLTDITYLLNFGTPSSFTRAFKRHYGITPSSIKGKSTAITQVPIPTLVKRPIKNINGDIVTNFTLCDFEPIRLTGIAFEVDLATDDYKMKIRAHSQKLLNNMDETVDGPCFVIFSDCEADSTRFKVLFGIPYDIQINKPYYFTVDIPRLFCAKFNYSGDLLDIGDVLKTDFARFLKITKQESDNSHIELIQVFENLHQLGSSYHIYTPIKKLSIDSEI